MSREVGLLERKYKTNVFDVFSKRAEGKVDNKRKYKQGRNKSKKVKIVNVEKDDVVDIVNVPTVQEMERIFYRSMNRRRGFYGSLGFLGDSHITNTYTTVVSSPNVVKIESEPEKPKEEVEDVILELTKEDYQIGTTVPESFLAHRYKGAEENTKAIVEYYWPILKSRISDVYNLRKHEISYKLDLDTLKYKLETSGVETDKHKFNFNFNISVNRLQKRLFDEKEDVNLWSFIGFELRETGNCCGSQTFNGMYTTWSGFGIGTILLAMIEDICRISFTTQLLCINVKSYRFTDYLLNRAGYTSVNEFFNVNSDNTCVLMSKELKPGKFVEEPIIVKKIKHEQKQ